MVKGEDGLYTGVLTLPKSTRFDLKILKNPTAGQLIWSAKRYASVLNSDGAYDFGEFTDNLVPNGNFEEGAVKWTPEDCIVDNESAALHGRYLLTVGGIRPTIASSNPFVIPPNQTLSLSFYAKASSGKGDVIVSIKTIDTNITLLEVPRKPATGAWAGVNAKFTSGSTPVEAQVVVACDDSGGAMFYDDMSLVSP
jgi:hypothetical protein